MQIPWLPPGRTLVLPGRGEVFYRHHQHADPDAPTVLLLHGWTASADLQFFTAYEELARHCSFIGIDHRAHGRGMRSQDRFTLEDAADDAAALLRVLGIARVVTVGYSMGGPISMLMARRHPDLVRGVVVQATAMEWRSSRFDRLRWPLVHLMGPLLRSWMLPRVMRALLDRAARHQHPIAEHAAWAAAEVRRNDVTGIVQAGVAIGRYDARPWASSLGLAAGALVTTRDRLVPPRKQRALAAALGAHVVEVHDDHLCAVTSPAEFSRVTSELVQHVLRG